MSLVFHTMDGIRDLSRYKHTIENGGAILGNGMKFKGAEYLNIDSVVSTVASDTVGTWLMWVNPVDATPAGSASLLALSDTDVNETVGLRIQSDGDLDALLIISSAVQWVVRTDSAVFLDGIWKRIGIVQNGVAPVLYVNGVAPDQTFSISTDTTKWIADCTGIDNGRIGDRNYNSGGEALHLTGKENDIRMHNDIWTAADFKDDYEETRLVRHANG